MTTYVGFVAGVVTLLAILGFVLAFTFDPNAINMGFGCALGAPFMWLFYFMMKGLDE